MDKNKITAVLKSRVMKNSAWLFLLQFANMILPMLTIPYITRILGTEGYGEYSLAYNWITYCQVFVEYGFALGGARKIAISDSNRTDNRIFSEIVSSRGVLFILSFVVINIICITSNARISLRNDVLVLMIVPLSVVFQANWIFQGKQQMRFISIINVAGRLLSVCLVFLFVKSAEHVLLYCFLYSVTFIFSSLAGILTATKKYKLKLRVAPIGKIAWSLKDNFPLFASAAISRIFGSIGITILGMNVSEEIVGGYSAVYKIPYILSMCFAPIGQALYPHISKRFMEDKKGTIRFQKQIFPVIFVIFAFIGLVIILERKIVVALFFGEEYVSYANMVLFLIPQMLFGILNNFLGIQTLVALGQQKQYTVCIAIGLGSLVLLNILLCPLMGGMGAAVSAMLAEMILTICLGICCRFLVWKGKEQHV